MKEKELKIVEPIIKNYQRDAYPLLAMAAKGDEYLPWIYSNFVQLMINLDEFENENKFRVMYCNQYAGFQSPFLETMKIKQSYFKLFDVDICDFISKNINNGFYVMMSIDKYYIPNTSAYNRKHKQHDILIYGYESNELKTLGYGHKGIFEKNNVPCSCFKTAFDNLKIENNWWNDLMYMFKYKDEIKYKFNLKLFKHLLWDYLNGENTAAYTQEEFAQTYKDIFAFGMDIYPYYKKYFQLLEHGEGSYDYIPMHLLVEHKTTLWKTIGYLEEQNIISKNKRLSTLYHDRIKSKFELFLRLFVKTEQTNNKKYIQRIIHEIDEVIHNEKMLLEDLYVQL